MTRFESYVNDRMKELTAKRREELEKACSAVTAKLDARVEALKEIADEGLKALNAKIDAQVKRWGWHVDKNASPAVERTRFDDNCCRRYAELKTDYSYSVGQHYANEEALAALKALEDFDESVRKAATRLVVLKKDLNMKSDAFDKAMADAVAKLLDK